MVLSINVKSIWNTQKDHWLSFWKVKKYQMSWNSKYWKWKTQQNLWGKQHKLSKGNKKQSQANLCSMMRTSDGDMEEFCCWCAAVCFQMESACFWAWLLDFIMSMREWRLSHLPFLQHPHPGLWRRRPSAPTFLPPPLHVHSLLLFKHAFSAFQLGSTWGCALALKTMVPCLLRLVFRCTQKRLCP